MGIIKSVTYALECDSCDTDFPEANDEMDIPRLLLAAKRAGWLIERSEGISATDTDIERMNHEGDAAAYCPDCRGDG